MINEWYTCKKLPPKTLTGRTETCTHGRTHAQGKYYIYASTSLINWSGIQLSSPTISSERFEKCHCIFNCVDMLNIRHLSVDNINYECQHVMHSLDWILHKSNQRSGTNYNPNQILSICKHFYPIWNVLMFLKCS